jgi:hypothetical protein
MVGGVSMTGAARGTRSRWRSAVPALATVAGVALLVWLNYYLRHTLESADQYMFSFFKYFYTAEEKVVFSPATPAWKLLLPIPLFTGTWTTTTLVMTHLLETWFRPATLWYVFNAIVIVASFVMSWAVFRSRVFSFTLAICMGFGTQLYHTYPNSGTISFPLLFTYFELLMLCAYKIVTAERHRLRWKALFVPALLVTAVAYEGWLDFLVFAWLASAYLFVILWRMDKAVMRRRLAAVVASMSAVGLLYVAIKISYGYGQTRGMESDVVFNYPSLAPAVEDVVSNFFTNFYMVATNFLPPMFVSSTALYQLGGERLVELQHSYHAPFSYLVPMQYVFYWRYFAGIAAVAFVYWLVKTIRSSWVAPSADRIALVVFMIMALTGGPTHQLVKARPMNSMPVQTYHVMIGVLGISLLISYLLMLAWQRRPRALRTVALVAVVWGVMFYSALARPAMISHESAQVGLGVQVFPNPLYALSVRWGRPYQMPAGLAVYQLTTPSRNAPSALAAGGEVAVPSSPPRFESALSPLPNQPPSLSHWTRHEGVSVSAVDNGYTVRGNATSSGDQLVSPPIAVPRHATLLVRVKGTIDQGRVCVGLMNETQQRWLVPADQARSEIAVGTDDNAGVRIVFANCGSPPAEGSRFRLESITYGLLQNPGEAGR